MSRKNRARKPQTWTEKKRAWARRKKQENIEKLTPEERKRYFKGLNDQMREKKQNYIWRARASRRVLSPLEEIARRSNRSTDDLIINLINKGA